MNYYTTVITEIHEDENDVKSPIKYFEACHPEFRSPDTGESICCAYGKDSDEACKKLKVMLKETLEMYKECAWKVPKSDIKVIREMGSASQEDTTVMSFPKTQNHPEYSHM